MTCPFSSRAGEWTDCGYDCPLAMHDDKGKLSCAFTEIAKSLKKIEKQSTTPINND